MDMEEVCEDYRSSLADLNCNSKPLINMLTMLAEDNVQNAHKIVQVIETHLQKVSSETKLPVMYLIDSIIKNVGGAYLQLFTQNIVSDFCAVFEKVDEKTRIQLFKLRQTWSELFPQKKMWAIDVRVRSIDPAWPITAPKPAQPTIHLNPKFLDTNNKKQSSTTSATSTTTTTTSSSSTMSASTTKSSSSSSKPESITTPKLVDQQAEVRQQVFAKQQELLRLQQQRLELELLQAKVKLEEQTRQLQIKSQQQHQAVDPRLANRDVRTRDPRIAKMLPSVVQQPVSTNRPKTPLLNHPGRPLSTQQTSASMGNVPSSPPILSNSSQTLPSKIVIPPKECSPSKSSVLVNNSSSQSNTSSHNNSKNNSPNKNDKSSTSSGRFSSSPRSPLSRSSPVSRTSPQHQRTSPVSIESSKKTTTNKSQKQTIKSTTTNPMIIDLTNEENVSELPVDPKSKIAKNSSFKRNCDIKKEFSNKNKLNPPPPPPPGKKKLFSTTDKRSRDNEKKTFRGSGIKSGGSSRKSRSITRSRSRSRSPSQQARRFKKQAENKNNRKEQSSFKDLPSFKKNKSKTSSVQSSANNEDKNVVGDSSSKEASSKCNSRDVDLRISQSLVEDKDRRNNKQSSEKDQQRMISGTDKDQRSNSSSTTTGDKGDQQKGGGTATGVVKDQRKIDGQVAAKDEEGKENNEREPPSKKAKLEDIDSLFGGKDQDYRQPPVSSSPVSSTSSHEITDVVDGGKGISTPERLLLLEDRQKQKNWAQYKANHPDEYKSPLRPIRDNPSSYYNDSPSPTADKDFRFHKSGRVSTESREKGFDRLGRPLLSRMKFDRRQDQNNRYPPQPWQSPEEVYLSQISLMLEKQDDILRDAENHLQAGIISQLGYQNVVAKFQGLKEQKIRLTLARDQNYANRNRGGVSQQKQPGYLQPGLCLPISKPIFLDGKMRKIKFFGRRAIVIMEANEPHEVSFSGKPTAIFLDDRELFRLCFGGECKEFLVEGSVHTVMFGAPSREVYVDGVPYQASFGGAAVPVHLDGKVHYLRLDVPQPSVELSDDPVRGLPDLQSDDDDEEDDHDATRQIENNGWLGDRDQYFRDQQKMDERQLSSTNQGDVDMRVPLPAGPVDRLLSSQPGSPRSCSNSSEPSHFERPPWEPIGPNSGPPGPNLDHKFRPGPWNSPRRDGNQIWNGPERMDWNQSDGGGPGNQGPPGGVRPNFQNFHPTDEDNSNGPWNGPDWDWRMGPNRGPNNFPPEGMFNDGFGVMNNSVPPMGGGIGGVNPNFHRGGEPRPNFSQQQHNHNRQMGGGGGGHNMRGGVRGGNFPGMRPNRPLLGPGAYPPNDGNSQQQFGGHFRPRFGGLLGNQPRQRMPPPTINQNQHFKGNFEAQTITAGDQTDSSKTGPPGGSAIPATLGDSSMDISALLSKLVSSGLIQTETVKNSAAPSTAKQSGIPGIEDAEEEPKDDDEKKMEVIPPIELASDCLKGRYPGVTSVLYRGTQCASCGMRFKDSHQEKYSQHLDWHFRANRREKDGVKKAFSRKWFYDVEDWIQFEEIEDLEDRARSFFELQAGEEQFQSDPAPLEVPSVPASQDQAENVCVVCSEPFQLFWVEEEEEWHLRGAIRKEGKSYHPLCHDDFIKATEAAAALAAAELVAAEIAAAELAAAEAEKMEQELLEPKKEPTEIKEEEKETKENQLEDEKMENVFLPREEEGGEKVDELLSDPKVSETLEMSVLEKETRLEIESLLKESLDEVQAKADNDVGMKEADDKEEEGIMGERVKGEEDRVDPSLDNTNDDDNINIKNNDDDDDNNKKAFETVVDNCSSLTPAILLEEEIIGVLSESELNSEDERRDKPESKMVVLQPSAGLKGKIVMKIKADSIVVPHYPGRSFTGSSGGGNTGSTTDSNQLGDNTGSTGDPGSIDEQNEYQEFVPGTPDPRFTVYAPVQRGTELSGLCTIM